MDKVELILINDPAITDQFVEMDHTVNINTKRPMVLKGIVDGKVYGSIPESTTVYEVPAEAIDSDDYIKQVFDDGLEDGLEEVTDAVTTLLCYRGDFYQRTGDENGYAYRTVTTTVAPVEPPPEPEV